MENTESLDPILWFVDFEVLNANEQKTVDAERYWTVEGTAELKQQKRFCFYFHRKYKSLVFIQVKDDQVWEGKNSWKL